MTSDESAEGSPETRTPPGGTDPELPFTVRVAAVLAPVADVPEARLRYCPRTPLSHVAWTARGEDVSFSDLEIS